ncbi:HepT-like ribonuclease domain-containing protein [Phormidium nigroviride]
MFIDNETRLRHMLDAAKEAISFAENRTRSDLDTDRMLTLSLVKSLEIIGEAAANITRERQAELPQLPWPQIIGMRNRLIHGYFDIKLDVVWKTLTDDLPPLIAELEKIIPSEQ